MATTAVKHRFATRDSAGIHIYGVRFWDDLPEQSTDGIWCSDSGPVDYIPCDIWDIITGLEFEPGTIKKNVQINTKWD